MGGFSRFFAASLACIAPFAAAYTQPTGSEPEGNPIWTPGKNVVPVAQPYSITWNPTTSGTVTLVLLKGPAANLQVVGPIVENIANSGSYSWTPESTLEPTKGDTGYGIQLIDDATGQYQYTMQFGISNSDYSPSGAPPAYGSSTTSSSTSSSWSSTSTASAPSGYAQPTGAWHHHHSSNSTGYAHPTGWSHNTTTHAYPTGGHPTKKPTLHTTTSMVVASTSASAPAIPTQSASPTGAASSLTASILGLVFAAGVAVFAL